MKKLICIFLLIPVVGVTQLSQEDIATIEKLNHQIETVTHDSDKVNAYVDWDNLIFEVDPILDLELNNKIELLCSKNLKRKDLNRSEQRFFEDAASTAFNNLGIIYSDQGKFKESLAYYNKSLALCTKLLDTIGISMAYNNIGNVYSGMGDDDEALKYCLKSIELDAKMNYSKGLSSSYVNIGNIYSRQGDNDKAMEYYLRSLKIDSLENNESGIATCYNNIGSIHQFNGDYELAIDFYEKGLEIRKKTGNKQGIAYSLNAMAGIFRDMKKNQLAIKYAHEALTIGKEIKELFEIQDAYSTLYDSYYNMGDFKTAHGHYKNYITIRDSLDRIDNQKAIIRQDFQHEYNKQKAIDDLAHENKIALVAEKEKRQRLISVFVSIGFILVVVFLIVIFKRLRVTRAQKEIIEVQKEEIEETHQEIKDSIAYAKRIQSAILPPERIIKENLPKSFVLYKPKDVVAGDFYWMERVGSKVLFAAADCTGHGVPGAMVSVVCNNALNRSVREYKLTDPGQILDKTREIVIQEFEKSEEVVKDGMDIALCSLEGKKIQFAGANNPVWIIREIKENRQATADNLSQYELLKTEHHQLFEIKANKQPIGQFDHPQPYTTHNFELVAGDRLYIFSDGYVDQFGGEKGKKFKAKALRALLLKIQPNTMEEQKTQLNQAFEIWKGNLEQIDDVCVIGVTV